MDLISKSKLYTAALGSIFMLLHHQPVQSQHILSVRENLQNDTIQANSSNLALATAVIPVQMPVQTVVKKEFARLPDSEIKEQFFHLQKDVPLTYNNQSKKIIHSFLTRDRIFISRMLEKQKIYFPIYEQMFQKYGLPDELKYLSVIESGLNPKAYSRARAAGLWQFMSATGKQYKLHQDAYVDERMDPFKATEAACRYLRDLHGMFGDWQLALTAYNCGPGNVRRAIRRSGNKTTFWQISQFLPKETRAYVPKYIAITYLMQHAADYNISASATPAAYVQTDTILVSQNINMELFAKHMYIDLEELRQLNPHVKRNYLPANGKNYCLRIPSASKEWFTTYKTGILQRASLNSAPGKFQNRLVYTVKKGDRLSRVAESYQVSPADIQRWNRLSSHYVQPGQTLVIYVSSAKIKKPELIAPIRIHFVKPGDTLTGISEIYGGVSVEKIKSNNRMQTNEIKPGQRIIIG